MDLPKYKPEATVAALTGKEEAHKQAAIFAKRKGYKDQIINSDLFYDKDADLLLWRIWLEQERRKDSEAQPVSICRVLSIDIFKHCVYNDGEGTCYKKGRSGYFTIQWKQIETVDGDLV